MRDSLIFGLTLPVYVPRAERERLDFRALPVQKQRQDVRAAA